MTTFDKFYAWAFPHIPSRDKIYAKLVELKVEQDKGFIMNEKTAIQKMVEWLEKRQAELSKYESSQEEPILDGQHWEAGNCLKEARRLAALEAKEKPVVWCKSDNKPCDPHECHNNMEVDPCLSAEIRKPQAYASLGLCKMDNWIIELPADFETMTEHEQEMNMEIAYRKRRPVHSTTDIVGELRDWKSKFEYLKYPWMIFDEIIRKFSNEKGGANELYT